MNVEDTIRAFNSCTADRNMRCYGCPTGGPGFGVACRQELIMSVNYWLEYAKSKNLEEKGKKDTQEIGENVNYTICCVSEESKTT